MNKLKEILAELKQITINSQPNIKFKEQMDCIEAIEAELNNYLVPPPTKSDIVDKALNEVIEEMKQDEIEQNDPLVEKLEESNHVEEKPDYSEENAIALAKIEEMKREQKQRGRKKKDDNLS